MASKDLVGHEQEAARALHDKARSHVTACITLRRGENPVVGCVAPDPESVILVLELVVRLMRKPNTRVIQINPRDKE